MPNNKIPSCCGEMFSRFMRDEKLRKAMEEKFEKLSGGECTEFFARMKPLWEDKTKDSKGEKDEEQSKA